MARKRKIKEVGEMEVELTKSGGPSGDTTVTKKVQATSQDDAVRKAQMGDTNRYDSVTVTNPNPTNPTGTNPSSSTMASTDTKMESKTKRTRRGKPMYENLRYPYSLMLPAGYRDIVRRALNENRVDERFGRVYICIENPEDMGNFVRGLKRQKSKSANQILNGIAESAK